MFLLEFGKFNQLNSVVVSMCKRCVLITVPLVLAVIRLVVLCMLDSVTEALTGISTQARAHKNTRGKGKSV